MKKSCLLTPLGVQWSAIHLPVQGPGVQPLIQEDPAGLRATKPVHHNYRSPPTLKPMLGNKISRCSEKSELQKRVTLEGGGPKMAEE